jgi:hypothetical protein
MRPDEPFDPNRSSADPNFKSQFEYDIASAVQRQKSFYYQVSLPHYRDEKFLEKGLKRYKMYLYLKSLYNEEFLVPCYDIDVIWHTHQVKPREYGLETKSIVGYLLPHDDDVNDRSPGSKLRNSEDMTVTLWSKTYGSFKPFQSSGAMFRGESPKGKLWDIPKDVQKDLVKGDHFFLSLGANPDPIQSQQEVNGGAGKAGIIAWKFSDAKKICLKKYHAKQFTDPENGEICLKITLGLSQEGFYPFSREESTISVSDIAKSSKKSNNTKNNNELQFKMPVSMHGSNRIRFDELNSVSIEYEIVQHGKATFCFCGEYEKTRVAGKWESNITNDQCNRKYFIDSNTSSMELETTDLLGSGNLVVPVTIDKLSNQPVWKKLSIKPGTFYDCVIPEHVESLWGPVPLNRLPENVDNQCKAVTHE